MCDMEWEPLAKLHINETYGHDLLPHGSGIDSDWIVADYSDYGINCFNSFHVMDENGMYAGWADFYIMVDIRDPLNFSLHFRGNEAQSLNRRFGLREYLEDLFAECFSGILREAQNV